MHATYSGAPGSAAAALAAPNRATQPVSPQETCIEFASSHSAMAIHGAASTCMPLPTLNPCGRRAPRRHRHCEPPAESSARLCACRCGRLGLRRPLLPRQEGRVAGSARGRLRGERRGGAACPSARRRWPASSLLCRALARRTPDVPGSDHVAAAADVAAATDGGNVTAITAAAAAATESSAPRPAAVAAAPRRVVVAAALVAVAIKAARHRARHAPKQSGQAPRGSWRR
jgi:hypothetical protein